jgi:hypothetical protein
MPILVPRGLLPPGGGPRFNRAMAFAAALVLLAAILAVVLAVQNHA